MLAVLTNNINKKHCKQKKNKKTTKKRVNAIVKNHNPNIYITIEEQQQQQQCRTSNRGQFIHILRTIEEKKQLFYGNRAKKREEKKHGKFRAYKFFIEQIVEINKSNM